MTNTVTTIAAMAMLASSFAANAGAVSEKISVDTRAGKVVVKLTLRNASAEPVYVPKALYEDNELFGPAFTIEHLGSASEVQYIGPMVKRGALTAEDFLKVAPGASRSNQIDITDSYAFLSGKQSYRLSHAGRYLPPAALADAHKYGAGVALEVAPVTFSYSPP